MVIMNRITTKLLILRKATHQDKSALISEIGAWDVTKWLTRVPFPYTDSHADEFLRMTKDLPFNLNIFRQEVLIGGVVLAEDSETGSYELGYWLGASHWGHGYATEATRAFLDVVKMTHGAEHIKASYIIGNDASAHVLGKLGFRETGTEETFCLPRKEMVTCMTMRLKP
jgi:RimJ/RimL family protein N-acetyltransferase